MPTHPKLQRLGEALSNPPLSLSPIEKPSEWLATNFENIKLAWRSACGNIEPTEDLMFIQRLIYPRLLTYTLCCIRLMDDAKLYMDFKIKLKEWNRHGPITLLRSHRSIKETAWAYQNRCKIKRSSDTASPIESGIKKLLRLDVLAIAFQVLSIAGEDQLSKSFYDQRGPHGQTLLDLLQDILDVSDLDLDTVRPSILKVLQGLSERSGLYPTSLILNDVEPQGQECVTKGLHGDVWMGTMTGHAVAIKVMRIDPNFISRGTELFSKSAIIWRQFRHPNVMLFVGLCQWPGLTPRLWLVTPWMKNGNIIQYLQKNRNADIRSLLMDIAQGLNYLHNFNPPIIHGNLRGSNILITSDQSACISDTGLSILACDSSLDYTQSAKIFRSDNLLWLAPEFFDRSENQEGPHRDKATDIYSLGCVYYEAFAGHPRFVEMHDYFEIINAVRNDRRPLRPMHDALDDAIWDLMDLCWKKDAALRPTADAVFQYLISNPCATIDLRSPVETSFSFSPVVQRKSIMFQDIIIALIGPTGSGKSNFIRVATGDHTVTVGDDLDSCTQDVRAFTFPHASGCNIVFVDTPGFDDTEKTDFEVLEQITDWLNRTYREQITLNGLLFFHRITDARMRGTPLRILHMFEALCGKDALQNVVLTTTMWDQFEDEPVIQLKEERERQLHDRFWKPFLAGGSRTARFRNTRESAWDIIRLFDINSPVPTLEQREAVDLGKKKEDTSAFKVLARWWDQVLQRAKDRFFRNAQPGKRH